MKIEQNKIVSLSYKLEADGEIIETVTREKPMQFMYGVGYLLPKFEEQIKNMRVGDRFDFVLNARDAYGEWDEDAVFELSKQVFEVDGQFDAEQVKVGESIPMRDDDGNRLFGTVEAINSDTVTMNFNHPLAGSDLHFSGEVTAIREATPEDLSGKCGCNCDCDCENGSSCDCESDSDCNCHGCGCASM